MGDETEISVDGESLKDWLFIVKSNKYGTKKYFKKVEI